ncbi:hypothetical protein LH435_14680 [Laribacter hongkongensis]|uniref:Uncharacterized protein n=1 Tax=Laribacter hongkongensis (strain HLHK9) TaxID=557598 RepID=C1DBP7_LARHH|nr:hypothetical protein [Laribacter hongkongensis]ACO75450.1 hypothetical protein LHK_02468 [Laribacter hongkongensis HLHK9]MCG8996424.1 hypothetical protein [Laribacter hongkongensis]MCG9011757.1 hypothetical protein [Laribacter hongkongensis]MCG9022763.1 hypothetical protein [Laribacter hongkongensis]MCG9047569.1 hypothetical protein [Laribacter hongkongensis]
MSNLSSVVPVLRGMADFRAGQCTDITELESRIVEFQRECLSGTAAVGALVAAVDHKNIGIDPGTVGDTGYLVSMLSSLAFELTNWLEEICIARTRHNLNP